MAFAAGVLGPIPEGGSEVIRVESCTCGGDFGQIRNSVPILISCTSGSSMISDLIFASWSFRPGLAH